jgi:hypothetical protein
MKQRARFFAFFLLVAIGAAGQYAQAAEPNRELRQTRITLARPASACEVPIRKGRTRSPFPGSCRGKFRDSEVWIG